MKHTIFMMAVMSLFLIEPAVAAKKNADTGVEQGSIYIHYEGINNVAISDKEINRVVGQVDILDIKYPKSDKIIAKIEGKNAYIQYRSKKPTLTYITTKKHIYTVRLRPSKIGAQTIMLGQDKEPTLVPLYGNEREKVVVKLLKAAFLDSPIMDNATITKLDNPIRVIKDIDVREHRRYDFNGDDMYLKVFILKLKPIFKGDRFPVEEKHFLIPQLCSNPLGLAIEKDHLSKNEYTRLFIVGRR